MKNNTIISIAILAVLVLGGLYIYGNRGSKDTITLDAVTTPVIQNEDYEVKISTIPAQPEANEETMILVETLRQGERVNVYEEERMLHVVLSSENRQDFMHTVQVFTDDIGLYHITHSFTQSGDYRIWVEIDNYATHERHGEHADLLAYTDVKVGGGGSLNNESNVSGTKEAKHGDFAISLAANTFAAGENSLLHWQVRGQDGNALELDDHEPAIYVIVGPDLSFFRHAHAEPGADRTSVNINDVFPEAGEYLLWAETFVKDGSEIITVPARYWLTVEP